MDDSDTELSPELARATWLVVPLFNEGQVIREVVTHARETFPNVVCVDDGSSDDSAAEARAAGAHVVRHPFNLGQGAALRTGLDYALRRPGAEYFVTFDSDGQHRVVDAVHMVRRLAAEPLDVVVGSRFLDGRTKPGLVKVIVLRTAVLFQNLTTGVRLTDAHNGLRALNRRAAEEIDITQNRMAHASEIITEIGRAKLRYAEEPVLIEYTDYSRSKGQSIWNSVNILSDLIFK
ncbi:glycosyltransferase family 2 protein [Pseudoclavibacter chungangensis]|uniref:Glycosyltransferase family 2 protein n=2 Tax=Pseudoclavibacter chungangensis TaxID=587635 RepID=A0A7J5C1C9_9MICO|nr:glycosyltransferase family 2 protein [Pseudoclavibacter chungangensis]KAB1659551.1 glycosyltransferase family 2 protein [Pseudoclavibacter chungangensis]